MKHQLTSAVRTTAREICHYYWNLDSDKRYTDACLEMAQFDPEFGCRLNAIGAVGRAFQRIT